MNKQKLMLLAMTTASMALCQLRLPNMSGVKDKLAAAKAPAAKSEPAPAAATAAPATAAPTHLEPGPVQGRIGDQGVELTMCEQTYNKGYDVFCGKPTRMFEYKGSVTNVFGTMRFTPILNSRGLSFKAKVFKDGTLFDSRTWAFRTGGATAVFSMTITPGFYELQLVDEFNEDHIALTHQFLVKADTVGARATDNIKAGIGKISVCSEVDDNWKCLNESTTWKANTPFNLYIVMPERIPGQITGWMIYKANADGSDGQCVDQLLQGTNGPARYWATTNGNTLPAGTYNIYSVNWTTRTTSGNMKEYFGKTTLVVK